MSRAAQTAVAIVWIAALLVVSVDAHEYVVNGPWWPPLIPLGLASGAAATALIIITDIVVRRRSSRK